ncbi:DNA-directed RNA polymerase subunit beta [Medicago truncatula]|uniref:DNA-directed RNA polymerase n=1 Tax=Medicago truncatula TaxID=3880 RepID=G7IQ86_MEDTR|nr:DNA-directed RNA polymerase subunit beta [Medicago truncatula]
MAPHLFSRLPQIIHGRKLSHLNYGGLTGRIVGFWIWNNQHSHYGRICSIDTSKGINVALFGSLAIHARIICWGSVKSQFL